MLRWIQVLFTVVPLLWRGISAVVSMFRGRKISPPKELAPAEEEVTPEAEPADPPAPHQTAVNSPPEVQIDIPSQDRLQELLERLERRQAEYESGLLIEREQD